MTEGEISVHLGKAQAYLSVVRNNSKEKYLRMLSFDRKNKYNSIMLYRDYVIDLFCRASYLEQEINIKEMRMILDVLGYSRRPSTQNNFRTKLNMIIDEDNFMTVSYGLIQKVEKFIELGETNGKV
jgi:hypothetical protein